MTTEIQCPIRRDGLCVEVIKNTEQVKNLTAWQKSQNGMLGRIEQSTAQIHAGLAEVSKALGEHISFHLGEEKAESLHQTGRRWSIQMVIMLSNVIVGLLAIGVTIAVMRIWR